MGAAQRLVSGDGCGWSGPAGAAWKAATAGTGFGEEPWGRAGVRRIRAEFCLRWCPPPRRVAAVLLV